MRSLHVNSVSLLLSCPSLAGVAGTVNGHFHKVKRNLLEKSDGYIRELPSSSRLLAEGLAQSGNLLPQLGDLGFEPVEPIARRR